MKNKKAALQKTMWLMLIASPLLAMLFMGMITGTSAFSMDAWNTEWNDEAGYYTSVQTMRTIGRPTGIRSYNEVPAPKPSYGSYHQLTYIPYWLLSFVTGTASHNFIVYCNVMMIMLAFLICVILLRPGIRQTAGLLFFECAEFIHARYIWSGMSEAGSIFMTVIVLACSIWLWERAGEDSSSNQKPWKENMILLFETAMILFYGIIRPYLFAYILFPIVYIVCGKKDKNKKIIQIIVLMAVLAGAVGFAFFLEKNYRAPYFGTSAFDAVLSMMKHGQLADVLEWIVEMNRTTLAAVWNQLITGNWIGIVTAETFAASIILASGILVSKKKNKNQAEYPVIYIFIIVTFVIYEFVIVLYSATQLHRMMLSSMAGSAVLCGMLSGDRENAVHKFLVVLFISFSISCHGRGIYALPQENSEISSVYNEMLCRELQDVLPYDDSGNEWDLTIAALPEGGGLQIWFCMPPYMGTSTCSREYLEAALDGRAVKSRYILAGEADAELRIKCEMDFRLIWKDCGWVIYERMGL